MKQTIFAFTALLLASQAAFAGNGDLRANRDPADANLNSVQLAAKESREIDADLSALTEKTVTVTISNKSQDAPSNAGATAESY